MHVHVHLDERLASLVRVAGETGELQLVRHGLAEHHHTKVAAAHRGGEEDFDLSHTPRSDVSRALKVHSDCARSALGRRLRGGLWL